MAFVYSHTCGCSQSTLSRPHQLLIPPRSFSTTLKPSLAGAGTWKGLRIATQSNFDSSRKLLCKLLKGDAAGERAFDDDDGGGGSSCDGTTSWLHYLMEQAGIDTSHAQVSKPPFIELHVLFPQALFSFNSGVMDYGLV